MMERIDLASVWQPDPSRHSPWARIRGTIRLSARQLRHRLLESVLIVCGIALGVGVLTGMESLLRFLVVMESEAFMSNPELYAVTARPRTFDTNQFFGADGVPAVRLAGGLADPISFQPEDLIRAREGVPGVQWAAVGQQGSAGMPVTAVDGAPLTSPEESGISSPFLMLEGSGPDDLGFRDREMLAGRWMTWDEFADKSPVLVLEETSVPLLFPQVDPSDIIGRTITTSTFGPVSAGGSTQWRVIGVVAEEQRPDWLVGTFGGDERSIQSLVPLTSIDGISLRQMSFTPDEGVALDDLVGGLEVFFAQMYGEDRVSVDSPIVNMQQLADNRRSTTLTLMSLAGLALLVAAVNILNLFTARVIRRRRTTAMSVALGAERRSLFNHILTEALLLGIGGSVLGLAIAAGIVSLLKIFMMGQAAGMGVNPFADFRLGIPDALIGLGIGVGVSLLFGLYPAYLTASIDPADGLRRE